MGASSGRVLAYVGATASAALLALATSAWLVPPTDVPSLVVLTALSVLTTQSRGRLLSATTGLTTTSIVQLAAVALTGPTGAIIVGAAAWAVTARRTQPRVWLLNASMFALMGAGAGATYLLAGGRLAGPSAANPTGSPSPADLLVEVAGPLVLANIVMCLVNAVVLAGVISIKEAIPYRPVVIGTLLSGGGALIGYGLFGLLLVVLWDAADVGPLSALLLLAPLFVARWAFAQYAEQNTAHERTVAALVQAVEAKDHYTRGHSERVAAASVIIARTVGLSQQRTATLHFGGMLHDVGKLGVPTRVLQKTGALTDEEFATIARHPVRGLEMVRDIEFLGEAFDGVLHHHERLDGRGYPMGLAGAAIPEFARIIAVADAFDSMTSTRSYRQARSVQDAVQELSACAGTQFDPRFVAALTEGLQRTTWTPAGAAGDGADPDQADPEQPDVSQWPVDSRDHDDPGFADEGRRMALGRAGHRFGDGRGGRDDDTS